MILAGVPSPSPVPLADRAMSANQFNHGGWGVAPKKPLHFS